MRELRVGTISMYPPMILIMVLKFKYHFNIYAPEIALLLQGVFDESVSPAVVTLQKAQQYHIY